MEKEFGDVLENSERKMLEKQNKYGDSWKAMRIEELEKRLNEEIDEFEGAKGTRQEEYQELLDIINISCMLATRIRTLDECSVCCKEFDFAKTTAKDKSICSKECEDEYYNGED